MEHERASLELWLHLRITGYLIRAIYGVCGGLAEGSTAVLRRRQVLHGFPRLVAGVSVLRKAAI